MITSSISAGSSCGTLSITARTIVAARSSGRTSTSDPLFARPIGLRAVATMTASGMFGVLLDAIRAVTERVLGSAGQVGELGVERVHVEVVAPERDAAVVDLEDAGDGQVHPLAVLAEAVGALVHHDRAGRALAVDDPVDLVDRTDHPAEDALDAVGSGDLSDRHVVVLDVVAHELARGIEVQAQDPRDELVDGLLGTHGGTSSAAPHHGTALSERGKPDADGCVQPRPRSVSAMLTWGEFQQSQPEHAAAGRAMLYQFG